MIHRKVLAQFRGERDIENRLLCPWCGKSARDAQNKRRVWHPECAGTYNDLNDHKRHYRAILDRDGDKCRICGIKPIGGYEIDHHFPLWLIDREKPDYLKYFSPDNLQLVCIPCHKAKTSLEATQRAKIKRILKPKIRKPKRAKQSFTPTPVKHI